MIYCQYMQCVHALIGPARGPEGAVATAARAREVLPGAPLPRIRRLPPGNGAAIAAGARSRGAAAAEPARAAPEHGYPLLRAPGSDIADLTQSGKAYRAIRQRILQWQLAPGSTIHGIRSWSPPWADSAA